MKTILHKISLLLLLSFSAFAANAQLNSWEIGLANHRWRAGSESTGWHQHTNIFGGIMRGRASLIDMIINGQEHKFRAGDLFGASFGTGYAREFINPNGEIGGPDTRKLGTMWLAIDMQAGVQAGFAPVEDIYVGGRYYKEWDFPWVVGSDYQVSSRFYNFFGVSGRYKRLYSDLDFGWNWDFNRSAASEEDHTVRVNLKYLVNDAGNSLGLRLDLAGKRHGTDRNDKLTAIELSFGRVF